MTPPMPPYHPIEDVCDCGAVLTAEEIKFYINRCNDCERAWSERLEKWRHGIIQDPELDAMFDGPKETIQ